MRMTLSVAAVVVLALTFYSFRAVESKSVEFLQKLGISEEVAKDCIWSSFSGMYLSNPGGSGLRQVKSGDRGALVKEIASYARAYTKSEEFKKKYLQYREGRKPAPPQKPKSMADQKTEQKAQLQKSITETEENMKKMPADQQATMKGVVDVLKAQLKAIDEPGKSMYTPEMEKMQNQGYEMQMQEYKTSLGKWETDNPSSPNEMIKRWLTEFLKVSKDVDFNATLVNGDGGRKLFAKTEYERKPDTWKMCFRAGKDAVEAGRTFARQWLDELGKVK